MGVRKLLSTLRYKQLVSLLRVFLRNPLLIYPTVKATANCLRYSDSLFPKLHHINNVSNAFRHALWNMLLMKAYMPWIKNLDKSEAWAKRFTDWHEEFSPNKPLEKLMDLHNNAYGRMLFKKLYSVNQKITNKELVLAVKAEIKNAVKITSKEQANRHKEQLIYLVDYEPDKR